jgi:hypothetical protein
MEFGAAFIVGAIELWDTCWWDFAFGKYLIPFLGWFDLGWEWQVSFILLVCHHDLPCFFFYFFCCCLSLGSLSDDDDDDDDDDDEVVEHFV